MKFAKKIYVSIQEDKDSSYYLAGNTVGEVEVENGKNVAIYELKEIKKVIKRTDLV